MIWETMKTLPFLVGKDVVSARWTSKFPKCERKKRGNEEIFRGCSFISHYMSEYKETVMQFLLHSMITVSPCCMLSFCTQAFWRSYPEVVSHCHAQGYFHNANGKKNLICNFLWTYGYPVSQSHISVHLHPNFMFGWEPAASIQHTQQ